MVFALYSGTIQFQTERDLNLTRLPAVVSPYLAKFIRHNKSNTVFLHAWWDRYYFFFILFIKEPLSDLLIQLYVQPND